jgi:predicted phosphodiesterase
MQNLLLIGDVHGKVADYKEIIDRHDNGLSIQLGDFGLRAAHEWHLENVDYTQHTILFGNHDDYTFLREPHSLGDMTFCWVDEMMTIRGAHSIDQHLRTWGVDWWKEEELTIAEMEQVFNHYEALLPKIVLSHECPQSVRKSVFGFTSRSRTSDFFQALFEMHQPDLWVFGHYHQSKSTKIEGTQFRCLAELETLII